MPVYRYNSVCGVNAELYVGGAAGTQCATQEDSFLYSQDTQLGARQSSTLQCRQALPPSPAVGLRLCGVCAAAIPSTYATSDHHADSSASGKPDEAALQRHRDRITAICAAKASVPAEAPQPAPRRPLHALNGQPAMSSPLSFQTASAVMAHPVPQPVPDVAADPSATEAASAAAAADQAAVTPQAFAAPSALQPGSTCGSIFAYVSGRPVSVSAKKLAAGIAYVKGLELKPAPQRAAFGDAPPAQFLATPASATGSPVLVRRVALSRALVVQKMGARDD